jgi:2-polyprenyl-3-methyl-5-hydroxy-6-metoxy-1,4-benzoquinol methylase
MHRADFIELQKSFWNGWNASTREKEVGEVSIEQSRVILDWLTALGRTDLNIIDIGCGSGWLCAHLSKFGKVTGTDFSDEVLQRASLRQPDVAFVAGDFMALVFPEGAYDVVTSLEVLSHVEDQPAFVKKLSTLLRSDGLLMLATQNRPVLEQNSISPPAPGQLRRWVDKDELRSLLAPHFHVEKLFSITPKFNKGIWRIANSQKLQRSARAFGLGKLVDVFKKVQEQRWRGWTLMVLARKPADELS